MFTSPTFFSRVLLQGALVISVRLQVSQIALLFCWRVEASEVASLEDVLDHFQMSLNLSTMSRNLLPCAVCRTRSPEAELLPAGPSADTEMISSMLTPGATIGTNLPDLQEHVFAILGHVWCLAFSQFNRIPMFWAECSWISCDWRILEELNMSRSFTQTVSSALSCVSSMSRNNCCGFLRNRDGFWLFKCEVH